MRAVRIPTVFVVMLAALCAGGCADRSTPTVDAQPAASHVPTATALWAHRQVDTLLADGPDTLRHLSEQLRALATIEGGDPDAALPMDLRAEEMDGIWGRVREKYDTEWVRGYMTTNTRAGFVHTLASLYVRDKAPALVDEMPGAFGSDAEQWPAWVESHKAQLGMD